jgi:predicted transcriptional regulator
MTIKKNIQVGGGLRDAAQRAAAAWHRAERGGAVEPEDTVTFVSWSALAGVMTDRRHALLRHLHDAPAPSIRALARALGRDYKRVHEDVAALAAVGLIEKRSGHLRADYDEIRTVITMRGAAA